MQASKQASNKDKVPLRRDTHAGGWVESVSGASDQTSAVSPQLQDWLPALPTPQLSCPMYVYSPTVNNHNNNNRCALSMTINTTPNFQSSFSNFTTAKTNLLFGQCLIPASAFFGVFKIRGACFRESPFHPVLSIPHEHQSIHLSIINPIHASDLCNTASPEPCETTQSTISSPLRRTLGRPSHYRDFKSELQVASTSC